MRPRTLTLALTLTLTLTGKVEAARKLTLPELVKLARERGPTVGVAEAELAVRKRMKKEALSLWAPQGEATYAITGAPRIECLGPGGEHHDTAACVTTVDPNTGSAVTSTSFNIGGVGMQFEARLLQPFFTFGKIESATKAAGHGVEAGRHQVEAARGEMEVETARAYWAAKTFRTAIATLGEGRDELAPWVDKVEKDLDKPKPAFSVNDLQRVKIALTQIDLLLAEFKKDQRIALDGLRLLTGEEVDVDDVELDVVEIVEHPVGWYEEEARTHRPELRALDEGVQAFRAIARLRLAEMLPDVGGVGQVTLRYASSVEDAQNAFMNHANTPSFAAFLGVRQPLDLFQRYQRLEHARADVDVIAAQRIAAMAGVSFEIDRAHGELVEARERLALTQRGQKIARGWLSAVEQNLDIGTGDTRDLTEAARQYFELRLRYFQAINDVNYAIARLRRASGVDVAR